jgi:hypothetical protein
MGERSQKRRDREKFRRGTCTFVIWRLAEVRMSPIFVTTRPAGVLLCIVRNQLC